MILQVEIQEQVRFVQVVIGSWGSSRRYDRMCSGVEWCSCKGVLRRRCTAIRWSEGVESSDLCAFLSLPRSVRVADPQKGGRSRRLRLRLRLGLGLGLVWGLSSAGYGVN